jgi:hypothetical protein
VLARRRRPSGRRPWWAAGCRERPGRRCKKKKAGAFQAPPSYECWRLVSAVLGQLAAGRPIDQVLEDYPYLEVEDILAALSFAAEAMQERELPLAQPA